MRIINQAYKDFTNLTKNIPKNFLEINQNTLIRKVVGKNFALKQINSADTF